MKIRELFVADVTRDIPPVIYFHEQSPEKLRAEVDEYIVTGGFPAGHPHHKRVPMGIHEQYVRLLRAIAADIGKQGGSGLPAAWISGFYGSGKSIFAKLLGLSLDHAALPDGSPLADAWLRRDTSPRAAELHDAWTTLVAAIDPVACVFDIGGVARDNEHIHAAVVRQVQRRLGYSKDALVAEFELRLERDDHWDRFVETAATVLDGPWEQVKDQEFADDDFSEVMHHLFPDQHEDPQSWIRTRGGTSGRVLSPEEATRAIADMLRFRAPGKTLFLVVDEVSQYIHQSSERMLRLQSFVSSLGQRLKGQVWLLATGQEKLEEESEATPLGKLKDRFPASLRVHLAATNIRDVVHKRLLHKDPAHEQRLRDLFQQNRANLRLYAYEGDRITEEDFVEVYPMLPGHVDLLLQITSALRTRSTRAQGDDHGIRGLLQLLGELFRDRQLADRDVGSLVTLDEIFEVQQTALDSDVRATLARVFDHCGTEGDELAARAARAVALLELIQDQTPTTPQLIAAGLYDRLDRGDRVQAVTEALERLRAANLLGYSEKHGYKVQSSAGQEWERERRDIGVTPERCSELIREKLDYVLGLADRPRLRGVPFPIAAWYSDGRLADDVRIKDPRTDATVAFDLRYLPADERQSDGWVRRSAEDLLAHRIVWVVGDVSPVQMTAGELGRSKRMLDRYHGRRESLTRDKQRLLLEEEARGEDLDRRLREAVETSWMQGRIYFRGRAIEPRDQGGSFAVAVTSVAGLVLPDLYPHFVPTAVTETELGQLLEPDLSGTSPKFLEGELGILSLDAGRYVPTCAGRVPAGILKYVEEHNGTAGATLFAHFGRPPFGYSSAVIRACLTGLLRATKIRIRPESGTEITSVKDPGTRDLFRQERPLRRADLFPAGEGIISARMRVRICKFFEQTFDHRVDRENDAIADAVYQLFPDQSRRLRDVEARYNRLPGSPATPAALARLHKALEDCRRSRQVEPTVAAVARQLDPLGDGLQQLGIIDAELTDEAIGQVRAADEVRCYPRDQLVEVNSLDDGLQAAGRRVDEQLGRDRPWQEIAALDPDLDALRSAYRDERTRIMAALGAQAERLRAAVRGQPGFEKLNADQSHHVLRPIARAVPDTTPEAVAPTLRQLQDRTAIALANAEEQALARLDEILGDGDTPEIVKVPTHFRHRMIATSEDLDTVVDELRQRVQPHLKRGAKVRLT